MACSGTRARRPIGRSKRIVASVLALSVFGAVACGGDEASSGPAEIAAIVQGREIPAAAVQQLTERYLQSPAEVDRSGAVLEPLDESVTRRFVLNYLIRLTFLHVQAVEFGVTAEDDPALDLVLESVTPEEFAELNMSADELRVAVEAGDLSEQMALELFPVVAISEDSINRAFEAQAPLYEEGWAALVSTAFVRTEAEATQLRIAVERGSDFLDTAEILGALEYGSMGEVSSVSPLSADVLTSIGALESGEVSKPIQASIGWLLFYVEARQDIPETPYAVARQEIVAVLEDQERQRLFDDWFRDRLAEADVEVDSSYGVWNPTSGSVRPS